ncbi:YeiH family protein [Anoxynatronum buryatiense]|nr:YeiH family protein [Anoxynatronum buryatiense]
MTNGRRYYPGIWLSLAVAFPAWILGKQFSLVGGPVFAILGGVLMSIVVTNKQHYAPGFSFVSKRILQSAVILLGFQLNLTSIFQVGQASILLIFTTICTALITAFIGYHLFHTGSNESVLIGVGTAICGGSAIAATAPVIGASDEEMASAVSTIFLYNIAAVLIFPPLGRLMQMTDASFGLWAGTAINDTSSVVAAGQIWSENALKSATVVKLVRTLAILPVTLVLGIRQSKQKEAGDRAKFSKIFPWFIMGFLTAALMVTVGIVPSLLQVQLINLGKFLIIMAMAAIGLGINVTEIYRSGKKPLMLGLFCWGAVTTMSLLMQRMLQMQ